MRQSKCHPPCKERRLPLEEQAHPEEIPLAPREGRRKGLFSNKDPHRREHVRYANEGVAGGEVGRVSRTGQTDEAPRTGVKGEFVGKHIPPDGRKREPAHPRTGPDRSDLLVWTFM